MAFCKHCGKELTYGARFCAYCGTAIEVEAIQDYNENQRKIIYDGRIYKCPNCGGHLDSFVTICPICGYELRNTKTTSAVHDLARKLENADSNDKKEELIRNFYIPNTKEDIYEFFILAASNITADNSEFDAWSIKLEHAYLKAKLAFGDGKDFKYIEELYQNSKKGKVKSKSKKALVIIILGLLLMIFGFIVFISLPIAGIPFLTLGIVSFIAGIIYFMMPDKKKK